MKWLSIVILVSSSTLSYNSDDPKLHWFLSSTRQWGLGYERGHGDSFIPSLTSGQGLEANIRSFFQVQFPSQKLLGFVFAQACWYPLNPVHLIRCTWRAFGVCFRGIWHRRLIFYWNCVRPNIFPSFGYRDWLCMRRFVAIFHRCLREFKLELFFRAFFIF